MINTIVECLNKNKWISVLAIIVAVFAVYYVFYEEENLSEVEVQEEAPIVTGKTVPPSSLKTAKESLSEVKEEVLTVSQAIILDRIYGIKNLLIPKEKSLSSLRMVSDSGKKQYPCVVLQGFAGNQMVMISRDFYLKCKVGDSLTLKYREVYDGSGINTKIIKYKAESLALTKAEELPAVGYIKLKSKEEIFDE